ncbi:hypothetical protein KW797_02315 [Candidatus Parcubacteria bacterium]|nr:hypothetical protein [Candidatus Parcubacteria bacterium]
MRKRALVGCVILGAILVFDLLLCRAARSAEVPADVTPPKAAFPFDYCFHLVGIVDGDTADVIVDLGFRLSLQIRVRLWGLNAPELHAQEVPVREAAVKAKEALASLLKEDLDADCRLRLAVRRRPDDFGRWLGVFYSSKTGFEDSVNASLLRGKFALPFMRSLTEYVPALPR